MFITHPDPTLQTLFRDKPYQGADPAQAEILFVGLDANYAADIAQSSIYPALLDYHEDGVRFWQTQQVHHPFLLPGYHGAGRRYHQTFARIGFTVQDAHRISFIEALHIPTCGRNPLEARDLDPAHLDYLRNLMLDGNARAVFMCSGVAQLLRQTPAFHWLPRTPIALASHPLPIWHHQDGKAIYAHLHFSVYGKFEARLQQELRQIGHFR